jgi:hypothetical protein
MDQPLDQARVERITFAILAAVKENYLLGPTPSRDRVLEALNALAGSAATIIAGCEDGEEAIAFFSQAFNQNLLSAREGFKKL